VTPVEVLLERLPDAKKSGNGWSARCPSHDDQRASLSVSDGEDGTALVKCHAGCETSAILAVVGLTLADLFPAKAGPVPTRQGKPRSSGRRFTTAKAAVAELERQFGKRSALWRYHDAAGTLVGLVVRWNLTDGKKNIRPVARHPDGWRIGAMPEPRPLYCLPEVIKASLIVLPEGEKAADGFRMLGFTATTSAGGSQAANKTDWRPLAGKEVWQFPDNDPAGRRYEDTVASILTKLTPAPVVRVIELPGLPEGGDIVDWINAHGDAADPEGMRAEIETLARVVEPKGTNPIANNVDRFRPFPVEALPKPIKRFVVTGAKAIGCDPSYLALPLLVALAAAIGNTRRLELKRGWSVPAILWGAFVGESGTAKTPAFKLVMKAARERQRKALERYAEAMKHYEADYARWEKEYAAWKRDKSAADDPPAKPEPPLAERFIVSDTTIEALAPILKANPRGVLLARDELAGWIGSFDRYAGKGKTGADAANWLSMFNAESIIVDRKTGIPRTIHVPQAAVCVTGGIQPGILQRALGEEHRESGLAARLLLSCPPRKPKRWTEADVDPNGEEELVLLFDRLYDLQPTEGDDGEARPVRLDTEAKAAWTAYYDAHAQEQADLTGDLSAAWSKLEEYAARLALVLHFTRWAANDPKLSNANILDAASMAAGIKLATWFKGEARRVYAMLGESGVESNQRQLAEWIERKGGSATVREVQQGCRWLKESGAAEATLNELAKAGRGTWQEAPTTPIGGRPSRIFVLLLPSKVYETPITHIEGDGSVDVDTIDVVKTPPDNPTDFPVEFIEPADPNGGRLFPECRGLPD
jgi:hypothetical protein